MDQREVAHLLRPGHIAPSQGSGLTTLLPPWKQGKTRKTLPTGDKTCYNLTFPLATECREEKQDFWGGKRIQHKNTATQENAKQDAKRRMSRSPTSASPGVTCGNEILGAGFLMQVQKIIEQAHETSAVSGAFDAYITEKTILFALKRSEFTARWFW